MDSIEVLMNEIAEALQIPDLFVAPGVNADLVIIVPLYAIAFAWLAYCWTRRHRPVHRHCLSLGARAVEGLLRPFSAVVFLALGLLVALARAAGRSTFYTGRRF